MGGLILAAWRESHRLLIDCLSSDAAIKIEIGPPYPVGEMNPNGLGLGDRVSGHHLHAVSSTFDRTYFRPFDAETDHESLLIENESVGIVF